VRVTVNNIQLLLMIRYINDDSYIF